MRLAVVTTHPIQYNAPLFKLLAEMPEIELQVFYTWGSEVLSAKFDPGFRRNVEWDIPLLEGYSYRFVENVAANKGSHHFSGINNPSLNSEILKWKPDSLLIFGWSFRSHLSCIRYFHRKIPIYFRGDSTILDDIDWLRKIFRKTYLSWVYKKVDYFLSVGANNTSYFLEMGVPASRIFIVPHAIDNDRFSQIDDDIVLSRVAKLKQDLGISESDFVILFSGKLEPKKNPLILVELMRKMPSREIKLLFVGNGQLEDEIKLAAKGDSRIIFLDFQNQSVMPIIYRLGNVFILPSKGPGETWGLALNEAMACGLPVIASDKVGGAIDLIRNGVNGYIFKSGDSADLLEKVRKTFDNQRWKSMGSQSSIIIKEFSFQKVVECFSKEVLKKDL